MQKRDRIFSFIALIGFSLLAFVASAPAQTPTTEPTTESTPEAGKPLVIIQKGDLPIILSAPHGGRMKIPDAPARTGANIPKKRGEKKVFVIGLDGNVDLVALQTADAIEKLTGKRPYVVVANFSRRYVDANRAPDEAYETEPAEAVYEQYHGAIAQFRKEILEKWHRGLIIDIHGHGRDPAEIVRGSADWMTLRHLVADHGKEAIIGPNGLLAPLAAAGYKITPPNNQPDGAEVPSLNGGFITRNYGSFAGGSFDSIQFELGGKYRKKEFIPTFAPQLANCIVPFMNRYILQQPAAPSTQPTRED